MKLMRAFLGLILLFSLLIAPPAQAQNCLEQVFRGGDISMAFTRGSPYFLTQPFVQNYLRGIYACPITQPVTLGSPQDLNFLIDGIAMVVWSSPDGTTFYIHRFVQVYPITAEQWGGIRRAVFPSPPINWPTPTQESKSNWRR